MLVYFSLLRIPIFLNIIFIDKEIIPNTSYILVQFYLSPQVFKFFYWHTVLSDISNQRFPSILHSPPTLSPPPLLLLHRHMYLKLPKHYRKTIFQRKKWMEKKKKKDQGEIGRSKKQPTPFSLWNLLSQNRKNQNHLHHTYQRCNGHREFIPFPP